jgi:hypothetical protein
VSLTSQMATDMGTILTSVDFGQTCTRASDGSTGQCLLDLGQNLADFASGGQAVMGTLTISKADFATVARYDEFSVGSYAWRMESEIGSTSAVWVLAVTRDRRLS